MFFLKVNGTLFRNGQPIDDLVCSWDDAVGMFLDWLRQCFPERVILVAHGNSYNDARFFIRDLIRAQYDAQEIESVIDGFVDTQNCFQTRFTGKR